MKLTAGFGIALLTVSAASAAQSVALAPQAPPLHELAHLDPPVCPGLVVHANATIAAILHSDLVVRFTVGRLRGLDLDGPDTSSRRAILADLEHSAADLNDHGLSAEAELKRLRDASEATDAQATLAVSNPARLHAFVDALAEAVTRQRRIATDLAVFAANMENRDMRELPIDRGNDSVGFGPLDPGATATAPFGSLGHTVSGVISHQPAARDLALAAATDFEARSADIKRDEAKAAEDSEAAVSGCP